MAYCYASLITSPLFSFRHQAFAKQPAVPSSSSQGKWEKSPLPKEKRPTKKTVFTRKQSQTNQYRTVKLSEEVSDWTAPAWLSEPNASAGQSTSGCWCCSLLSNGQRENSEVSMASLCTEPYTRWWYNKGSNSNKGNTWQSLSHRLVSQNGTII